MSLDLAMFGSKLSRYRQQFQASVADVAAGTGIHAEVLVEYESGTREPTGDDILIIADFYKCDYKFFLSNERVAPFDQTETLFRMHGNALVAEDRWAIQEFLFLCECEELLLALVPRIPRRRFTHSKRGTFFKRHGRDAAGELRLHLGYDTQQVGIDVFHDLRSIGLHVFRRQLSNSSISGLFIRHPVAGACVLVNYSEDWYRQRFTAAHEAGHAILDDDKEVVLSFSKWKPHDRSEVRANTFASHYLMPREFLQGIPVDHWSPSRALKWANRLKVSTTALSFALREANLISEETAAQLRRVTVSKDAKADAELPPTLSPAARSRKATLLKRGLSDFYVDLCFEAYRQGSISAGRLAEMLLVSTVEIADVAANYGERLSHGE